MKRRVLPWVLWGAFPVALAAAIYVGMSNDTRQEPLGLADALWAISFIGFPTTGALIASRWPGRPLGWLFCLAPLSMIGAVALSEWAFWQKSSVISPDQVAWFGNVLFGLALTQFSLIPYFLPNGKPPAGRWRSVLKAGIGVGAVYVIALMFGPGSPDQFPSGTNPLDLGSLAGPIGTLARFGDAGILAILLLGVVSVVARHRGAQGVERLQSKWIALGAGVVGGSFMTITLYGVLFGEIPTLVATLVTIIAILAFPVTIAMAILRHRMFDIDIIINRALVYAALSALLIGVYLVLVMAVQRLLSPVTKDSDLAIAASTLAVAAIVRPLRARVQGFIDRRFYRRKYDAERTLQGFSGRLRDEIDLDAVASGTVAVIRDTMQPAHASVWLRGRSD